MSAEQCTQCGTVAPLADTEHGPLCEVCAYRQAEHDETRDRFDHLSPSSLGFQWEDE